MKILTVDDDDSIRMVVRHVLERAGHEVLSAENGREGLDILLNSDIQLVVSDWEMPVMSGLEMVEAIRSGNFHRYIYTIMLTSRSKPDDIVSGLSAGADDFLTKPFNPAELRVRVRAGERIIALETRDLAIFAMAQMVESRDRETGEHLDRVRTYSRLLSEALRRRKYESERLNAEFCELIYLTSPLHDVGKIGVPDAVLQKDGPLTEDEYEIIKTHTLKGAETLQAAIDKHPHACFLTMARDIARSHHEWFDGSGYPDGLSGSDIPLAARIVTLADVYDALTSERIYKEAYSHELSKAEIIKGKGTQFDPEVVDAFETLEFQFNQIRSRYQA
jgi:putative two-component system response regulator